MINFEFKIDKKYIQIHQETRGPGALYRAQEYQWYLVLFFF